MIYFNLIKIFKIFKNLELLKSNYIFKDRGLLFSKKFSEKLNNNEKNIKIEISKQGKIKNI